jgi:hypothetical protein
VYRWCLSGTPVQNGIKDLKGLLLFLKSEMYWAKPTTELINFLRQIMWRHSREHVKAEIEIPLPTDTTDILIPTPTEIFCYDYLTREQVELESKVSMGALPLTVTYIYHTAKFFSLPFPVVHDALKKKKIKLNAGDLSQVRHPLLQITHN